MPSGSFQLTHDLWEISPIVKYDRCPSNVEEPTRFFAEASAIHLPSRDRQVFVYVTSDECLHGRLAVIAHSDKLAANLTLSDSRVTPERLVDILNTFSWLYNDRRILQCGYLRNSLVTREELVIADKVVRLAMRLALEFAVNTWTKTSRLVPDMARLFASAPAPVYTSDTVGLVTFAGGSVTVADATECEKFHRLTGCCLVDLGGVEILLREVVKELGISIDSIAAKATARILVGQKTQVRAAYMKTSRVWMDGILHVLVTGTPLAQVATLIHSEYEAIGELFSRRPRTEEWFNNFEWEDDYDKEFASSPLAATMLPGEARAVSQRHAAGKRLAQAVDVWADRVKEIVWRPDGRLASNLAARYS
jgi:hypothetical protein